MEQNLQAFIEFLKVGPKGNLDFKGLFLNMMSDQILSELQIITSKW